MIAEVLSGRRFAHVISFGAFDAAGQGCATLESILYGIPGFEVEDADAVYQQWKAKSVEILGEVIDMGAGRMFTAKDPEGHYIQVFHLYPQVREMQKQMGM